jgi:flagellar motor switch protein FliM
MTTASPLLARSTEHPALPGLDQIGKRVARGLRSVFADLGYPQAQLVCADVQIIPYGDWRAAQPAIIGLCRFHMKPMKGSVLMASPAALIGGLVDLFYGGTGGGTGAGTGAGTGKRQATDHGLSLAEMRLLSRMGEAVASVLDASWGSIAPVTTTLAAVKTDASDVALTKDDAFVAVQHFALSGDTLGPATLAFVYPVAALRPFDAVFDAAVRDAAPPIDPIWRGRMADAAMRIRLPLRTIFARPELPVARLLGLTVGDVIPLTLPDHIPVTVAGRLFAHASVGESSGRAAVRIEKIVEGSNFHE